MEVDLPYSFHTFSRTHKHTLLKAVPSIRNILGPNIKLTPQKKRSLPLESELATIELPPLQGTPGKTLENTRKRSSSTGGYDSKQAAFRKQFDSSPQERDRNPLRNRVELAPLTGSTKSSSKGYSSVIRKNSLDIDPIKSTQAQQQPDSIFQLRNRAEPIRAPLSQVFGVRRTTTTKKEAKTIEYASNNVSSSNDKEEMSSSAAAPKAWQDLTPKDLVFSPNVPQHIMLTHFLSVVQGIRYAIGQVKPLPISQLAPLQVSLRRKKEGLTKTLVLDLDETLVFAKKTEDDEVKEKFPSLDGNENSVFTVKIRPHAEEFLKEMSKEFEIIIFTAGEKAYAESVIKFLDPEQKYISHLLHRAHCLRTKRGLFIKDLRVILGRELKDMVIVDNFAHSFSFQIDNGIPIITWNGDLKDQELKYLMPYLLEAKKYDDMRQYNKEKLRLEELSEVPAQNFPNI